MPVNPFTSSDVELALGRRYTIKQELGVGGQGAVLRATRANTPDGTAAHDEVALKLHLDPRQDVRVEREIRAMQGLTHPALSRLIEHGFCDIAGKRIRYIAWEFIEGQSLNERLAAGVLPEREVLVMAADVADAVGAIWSRRIVHRDINPKNIMLKTGGGAVLIDLGGARHLDETTVTAVGATFGTVGYFSPEQARAERALSSASDVFSLGIVMVQSLLGSHPTGYDQQSLISGFRATGLGLNARPELLGAIDRMLSPRAAFRQLPTEISALFRQLQERT